jgi:hypothetical protein
LEGRLRTRRDVLALVAGDFCVHNNFAWRGVFALGLKLNVIVAQTNKDAGRSRDEAFVRHVSVYVSLWA